MMKKLLKKLSLVAIFSLISTTLQAQTPIVHLKFDNNLNNDGSGSLTFEIGGANSAGVTAPYSTNSIQGNAALNFTDIGDDTDPLYSLIQNGGGFDAQISSTTNSTITGSDARTISVWVRYGDRLDTTNGSHTIVNMGDPVAAGGSFARTTFTLAAANNEIQLGISGANLKHFYTNNEGIEDFDWHHIAFTYPAGGTLGDIVYYVDGVPVEDNDAGGGGNENIVLNTAADKIYIGTRGNNTTKWFDGGGIDDVRIYDVALTAEQMLAVYNENVSTASTTEVEDISSSIYPNPVSTTLIVKSSIESSSYRVINMLGKIVIETSTHNIDVSELSSGLYILKTDSGFAKFIKK